MASRSLTSLITLSIALCALPALAQHNAAPPAKNALKEHFIAEHESGRRFSIDPTHLPAPKSSSIVTNRSLTLPYEGQVPQVPAGFKATLFASGLANPRRLLVLPNGDVLVAEQSAGYLTLLREEGDGKAKWINRHVEDLNRPYGLAWRNDHVLVADQDALWRVPHTLGQVRPGRATPAQRADQVPPEDRKPDRRQVKGF
jgi:glucose/arabinose dehydrogenase